MSEEYTPSGSPVSFTVPTYADDADGPDLAKDLADDIAANFSIPSRTETLTGKTLTTATLGADLAAGGFKITGLADPTLAQDAATKNWTETSMTSQVNIATTQATDSANSATASAGSATASSTSAGASQVSRLASETAETNAETAETNAETAETNASGSASTATTQAGVATTQAGTATTQAGTATTQAGIATTKAAAAASSETASAASEAAASTSETNAATSETNAGTSASAASTSQSAASSSATAAGTSETNAAASETAAGTSETNSAASESAASTSESNAGSSASGASSSASAASTSESNASTSATSASNSAAAAAASFDQFDDRYLGSKASAPATDNDGNALVTGALYYNSTEGKMYVYDGSGWLPASAASVASIISFEFTATAGQTAFTGVDANGVTLAFSIGLIQVFLNGVLLSPGDDYTPTSGTVTLISGAAVSDVLVVVAFASFQVADVYTQAQADARYYTQLQVNNLVAGGSGLQDTLLYMGA